MVIHQERLQPQQAGDLRDLPHRRVLADAESIDRIPLPFLMQARALDRVIDQRNRRMGMSVREQREKFPGQKVIMQYDGEFDLGLYDEAYAIEDPSIRQRRLTQLDGYIRTQLITHIGEGMHVLLSSVDYDIDSNSRMFVTALNKTVMEMVHDGVTHQMSRSDHNPVDTARTFAETPEMQAVQDLLCDPNTPIGTMMLAISGPGGRDGLSGRESQFLHNYIDVFRLELHDGRKIVRLYRYSSGTTYEENLHNLVEINEDYFPPNEEPDALDALLISNGTPITPLGVEMPMRVGNNIMHFETPEDIQRFFHRNHDFMSTRDFQEIIIPGCTDLIERYIQSLHLRPQDYVGAPRTHSAYDDFRRQIQHATFNRLLMQADDLEAAVKKLGGSGYMREQITLHADELSKSLSTADILSQGKQENVQVKGGSCPGERGMRTATGLGALVSESQAIQAMNTSPFDVSGVGGLDSDEMGPLEFECAKGHKNRRPPHIKIPSCTHPNCDEKFNC